MNAIASVIVRISCGVLFALIFASCPSSYAQEWVRDMFAVTSHDFGTVPRGADVEYRFEFKNPYEEVVHVRGVSSSCGCTIARVEQDTLKTYETSSIVCEFNTRSFIGPRAAGITVTFDRPYAGQIQLMVRGNVRSDIETKPGVINFGDVPQGAERSQIVRINYSGNNQWKITDVRSANRHLSANLKRLANPGGRVEYEMQVRLLGSAPVSEINDQIVLETNEPNFNLVTIPIRGSVKPPLDVIVTSLGTVQLGTPASGRVTIKATGELPAFEVTKIECADDRFSFSIPKAKRRAHVIPFRFDTGAEPGAFSEQVIVHTSLSENAVASATISGNVAD